MSKVLVIEDHDGYFRRINEELNGKVEVLRATTLEEGEDLFRRNTDIDLIIMDACVPGDRPNSMSLVRKIVQAGFTKPIIACSGLYEYREELLNAGATHDAKKNKVAELALEILNL
ncbi:MAG: response regulator [Candidatus Moranbacteria bacterium]|nr:response regulator [Candidatus Moranbacteria bacterium]